MAESRPHLEAESMRKILIALVGAMVAMVFMGGVAGAGLPDDVVLPEDGVCPPGFELGYSDEFGEVCNETLERDGEEAAPTVTPAAAPAAGTLARTGSDSLPLAQLGAVLLALGGLVVLVTRHRRSAIES